MLPVFRLLDEDGVVCGSAAGSSGSASAALPVQLTSDPALLVRMYQTMIRTNVMDKVLYDAQRQGRISFYMTSFCEEAIHVGTGAALAPEDMIYAQYREVGVLLWRGFTLDDVMNQCFSNALDPAKGRQMPVHYGSVKLNVQTISSPLATQIPHAAGAGYAFRVGQENRIAACYFGEGAASEGDFHAALNVAATRKSATLFMCRNNGYAISTPVRDQYAGDGIGTRGPAYGMPTMRVDGNDLFAVYEATRLARQIVVESGPVLLEFMSYRGGHHSTSDDASRYRPQDEPEPWLTTRSPITRLRRYLVSQGLWKAEDDDGVVSEARKDVLRALAAAGKVPKPTLREMFHDVYKEMPPHLQAQERELLDHLAEYGNEYPKGF